MKKYLIPLIALFFTGPTLVYGQSDLVEIMTPNAIIIFDTSASMNSKSDGTAANPSNVKVDKDGNVFPAGTAPWNSYTFEGGGNHPNSKLYQAKLALKWVIKDLVDINLGFSTYAQFKTNAMVGQYKRDHWPCNGGKAASAATCSWTKLYWRWNNYSHSYSSTSSLPLGNFTDVWGNVQTGMAVGSNLYEHNHVFSDNTVPPCRNNVPPTYKADLQYTITSIVLNAEMNVYTYYYTSLSHDHYEEANQSVSKNPAGCLADCSNCNNGNCAGLINCNAGSLDFQNPWQGGGGWTTFYPGDPCYSAKWKCSNSAFSCQKAVPCTYGAKFQDWAWGGGGTTSCPADAGGAYNTGFNPALGDSWTDWIYVGNCYDNSSFTYPGSGTTNNPDMWSYFHTTLPQGGTWQLTAQPKPFYPSEDGSGAINDTAGTFDNHYFFINIPQVDDSTKGYPNKNAILALLDLTPVQNPQTGNYWTKLPLKPNSLTSNTSGTPVNQTPIADSLSMAKKYFDDYINQDTPSQSKCRGNYIILLTDGLESCRYLDSPTDLKPDFDAGTTAAKNLYNAGVNTFVIGFGSAAGTNLNALNNIAQAGSNNAYNAFFTTTLADLTKAIQAIFQIIGGSYGRSSPVVSTTRSRVYRGYFNLPGYEGHLDAFDLNPDGTIITPEHWDAGKVMNSNGRGPVTTWVDSKSKGPLDVNFTDKKGKKLQAYLNPLGEDINNDGKVDQKDAKAIIGFTLDPNYNDGINGPGYYKGVRSANWLLGDIYHSTPLVVGAPNLNFPDSAFGAKYSDFKTNFNSRGTVIYVGANDGMLHAFSDIDGTENFAIIPNNLLGQLKELRTNSHQFFVDSSPRAYDVFFGGTWSTVLVSGERAGGNYYFALDVTDPTSGSYPTVLWGVTDPGMGNTWSRPEIGWVTIGGQEKFVAFVGGGYSTTDNIGNTFYVIDIDPNTPDNQRILRTFSVGGPSNKVPAGATAFDSDLDGRVNGVYFGDINGVLWKIKIDGEQNINNWQLIQLYAPATNSPVFYPPAVTKNNQGNILVYYGQGNELDIFKVDNNSFFEIWDNADVGVKNWEEDFEPGEKMLAAPTVANGVVYFTTWKYTGDKTDCGAGKGRLWGLTTTTSVPASGDLGALVLDPITGADLGVKKKYFEITDYYASRGIPSAPVVTNGAIYLSTSIPADQVRMFRIPPWSGQMKLKKWREVF